MKYTRDFNNNNILLSVDDITTTDPESREGPFFLSNYYEVPCDSIYLVSDNIFDHRLSIIFDHAVTILHMPGFMSSENVDNYTQETLKKGVQTPKSL